MAPATQRYSYGPDSRSAVMQGLGGFEAARRTNSLHPLQRAQFRKLPRIPCRAGELQSLLRDCARPSNARPSEAKSRTAEDHAHTLVFRSRDVILEVDDATL